MQVEEREGLSAWPSGHVYTGSERGQEEGMEDGEEKEKEKESEKKNRKRWKKTRGNKEIKE